MPDKPWRPQDRTPEVTSQEIREVKQPEPSLDAHRGVETGRDLSRERSMEIDDLVVYDVVDNTCKGLKVTVRV